MLYESNKRNIKSYLDDKAINKAINWSLGSYLCEKQLKICKR